MNTVSVELTEQDVRNLLTFLDRVQLKGIQESMAYVDLVQKFDVAFQNKQMRVEDVNN